MALSLQFLTPALAEQALDIAYDAAFRKPVCDALKLDPDNDSVHLVLIGPEKESDDEPLVPAILAQKSYGPIVDPGKRPIVRIARSKAWQAWLGQNDGGTDIQPHLLFPGDTRYWASYKDGLLVGAGSGVKPWNDRFLASTIVHAAKALAYGAWKASGIAESDQAFV